MARYVNESGYRHDTPQRTGVLLTNLGTPDAPDTASVRRYLAEFLSDPRVVEVPRPIWWLVLNLVILRIRPRRSAAAYREVWDEQDGSPLLAIGLRQRDALRARIGSGTEANCVVELAMRYGNPSLASTLESLRRQNVRRLLVLPLYPQYSATTTASTYDEIWRVLRSWRWLPEVQTINQYHDEPDYIRALSTSIRESWAANGRGDRLLFSFHGVPKRYLLNGDPYHCQCLKTARLCAAELGLGDDEWRVSFQSRLGREEWLRPYTDEVLTDWAQQGVRRADVVCPGFSADCLETLEEVALQYGKLFVDQGGEKLHYIEALNAREDHIAFLDALIARRMRGWQDAAEQDPQLSARLAMALGAER